MTDLGLVASSLQGVWGFERLGRAQKFRNLLQEQSVTSTRNPKLVYGRYCRGLNNYQHYFGAP